MDDKKHGSSSNACMEHLLKIYKGCYTKDGTFSNTVAFGKALRNNIWICIIFKYSLDHRCTGCKHGTSAEDI